MVEQRLRCGPGPSDRGSVRVPPAANRRQDSCKQKEDAFIREQKKGILWRSNCHFPKDLLFKSQQVFGKV